MRYILIMNDIKVSTILELIDGASFLVLITIVNNKP